MFYFFMFLWFVFVTTTIVGLVYWLIKKKHGKRVLISFALSIVCFVVGVVLNENELAGTETTNTINTESENSQEISIAFDEKSWDDYLKMYEAHNYLMKAMNAFSNGEMSKLDFYDYCKNASEWFGQISISFNYGKTDDEKEYLSTFQTFALADQSAANSLMKYLDSNATKDLSNARENINRAKEAATIIAKNRIVLLKKIGLSEEEITEIRAQMITDLESIDKKVNEN